MVDSAMRGKGRSQRRDDDGMQFGKFDLSFAVDMLEFTFKIELKRRYVTQCL